MRKMLDNILAAIFGSDDDDSWWWVMEMDP